MAKQSREERLRKKREAEKRRQEKIKQNPEALQTEKLKNHVKYLNRLKKKQVIPIRQQSNREKRATRKRWKQNSKAYKERERIRRSQLQFLQEQTPPNSDTENFDNNRNRPDGRAAAGRRRLKQNRAKVYRQLEKTRNELIKSKRSNEKFKKRNYRLRKQRLMVSQESPLTKVNKILTIEKITSEQVKNKLLFGELMSNTITKCYKGISQNSKKRFLRRTLVDEKLKKRNYRLRKQRLMVSQESPLTKVIKYWQ